MTSVYGELEYFVIKKSYITVFSKLEILLI